VRGFREGYIWIQTMLIGRAYIPKAVRMCVCVCVCVRAFIYVAVLLNVFRLKIYIKAHMYPKFRVGVCWQTRAAISWPPPVVSYGRDGSCDPTARSFSSPPSRRLSPDRLNLRHRHVRLRL